MLTESCLTSYIMKLSKLVVATRACRGGSRGASSSGLSTGAAGGQREQLRLSKGIDREASQRDQYGGAPQRNGKFHMKLHIVYIYIYTHRQFHFWGYIYIYIYT